MKIKHLLFIVIIPPFTLFAQQLVIESPDHNIKVEVNNGKYISCHITYKRKILVENSSLGFEFKTEPEMQCGFAFKTTIS